VRLTDRTFRRAGGTFRRYYALEDVARLAERAALTLTEGRYCCVRLENKKKGTTMDRVYVHAVLTKPL
jgi:methyltransferase-like protein 6